MLIIENTSLQINYQSTKKLGFQNFIHIVHKDATRRNSKIPTQKMESIRVAVKTQKKQAMLSNYLAPECFNKTPKDY
jgi:hypothetical protein